MTIQERRLQALLRTCAGFFALLAIFSFVVAFLGGSSAEKNAFAAGTSAKAMALAVLCFLSAADVRRFRHLVYALNWSLIFAVLLQLLLLVFGRFSVSVPLFGIVLPLAPLTLGADLLLLLLLGSATEDADRAQFELLYLSPWEFRALMALSEVLVMGPGVESPGVAQRRAVTEGDEEAITPEEIAHNVDRYLSRFNARGKWIAKLALTGLEMYPLLSLRPPLSAMVYDDRLSFIRSRFYQDVTLRLIPKWWRVYVQAMIRMGSQLSYLGYYNDARTYPSIGYVPFSKRDDRQERITKSPPPERTPLHVMTPRDVTGETLEGDIVVIGSGAAAAVLAHGLAKRGKSVLMLERGKHVDPSQFTEDEMHMLSQLYSDGALQLSRDFRLQVLQGSCVGGTTVINNAVSFRPPTHVLDRWADPRSLDWGIDPCAFLDSVNAAWTLVGVQGQEHQNLNRGAAHFNKGVDALLLGKAPNVHRVVDANISGCLGCGYCNIGCSYGKKLSMLDTILPRTQGEFGRDQLRVLSECEATQLRAKGARITGVRCRLSDGRTIEVRGKTFVVAAGAISSSLLLIQSGIGGDRVGKRVSFNLGSPMSAVFDEKIRAYDGLQISHYLERSPDRGYIIETWYNPPVSQALAMPGWFDDHFKNMRRYDRMSSVGILVGSAANAEVSPGLIGRGIKYNPLPEDFRKILEGVILAGRILLSGGARMVLPHTFKYYEFTTEKEVERLTDLVTDHSEITLGTGHPQGGNVMSRNRAFGVVDPEFRVYGYDNLFVCDASVFPGSVGVNPQLTVMGFGHHAVPFVANSA